MGFWDRVVLVSGGHPSAWAARIGLNPTTVTHWKDAPRTPYASTMDRLVEKTGIPAEWWLKGEGEIPPDAARRFGLLPATAAGVAAPAPVPEVLAGAPQVVASQLHARCEAMLCILARLWLANKLDFLHPQTTLEQAVRLANLAAPKFAEESALPRPDGEPQWNELEVGRYCLMDAWNQLARDQLASLKALVGEP